MSEPLSDARLADIQRRTDLWPVPADPSWIDSAQLIQEDIPALLAEVERLRAALRRLVEIETRPLPNAHAREEWERDLRAALAQAQAPEPPKGTLGWVLTEPAPEPRKGP